MKLNEWQLIALVVGTFAAVVIADIGLKYSTDEAFKDSFSKLPTSGFAMFRKPEMLSQEMNVPVHNTPPTIQEPEPETEG
jgi:hypothetical protein